MAEFIDIIDDPRVINAVEKLCDLAGPQDIVRALLTGYASPNACGRDAHFIARAAIRQMRSPCLSGDAWWFLTNIEGALQHFGMAYFEQPQDVRRSIEQDAISDFCLFAFDQLSRKRQDEIVALLKERRKSGERNG